jgi:hypothetical protein
VDYILKIYIDPTKLPPPTSTDTTSEPGFVILDGSVPDTAIVMPTSATINGVVYAYPSDFDYTYSYHVELNIATGNGLEMVQETLTFNHLPGHPTLLGRAEEKVTAEFPTDISHLEILGNFQLTGTKMFSDVAGSGTGMFGQSTGLVVYHFAWISGWPL